MNLINVLTLIRVFSMTSWIRFVNQHGWMAEIALALKKGGKPLSTPNESATHATPFFELLILIQKEFLAEIFRVDFYFLTIYQNTR